MSYLNQIQNRADYPMASAVSYLLVDQTLTHLTEQEFLKHFLTNNFILLSCMMHILGDISEAC